MQRLTMAVLLTLILLSGGCSRKRNLADIPISTTMTVEDYEEQVGSPAQIANSNRWIAYKLKDGTELRLFFSRKTTDPLDDKRTLATAWITDAQGHCIKSLLGTDPHAPATRPDPATAPTADPSTLPAAP